MNDKLYLNEEFDRFWGKILNGENFAFMRNADGELAIMQGRHVAAQEGNWVSPNYVSKLGEAIYESLSIDADNAYYAISCPCCDEYAYNWYMSRVANNKNVTFANLWINNNYKKFKEEFPKLNRDAILIANFRAEGKPIGNLNILKHYKISDDCIGFWENDAEKMINEIKKDFGNKKNLLYVVSAGPMSGPIIAALYRNNPHNCYVDFGSSIDIYYRGAITRPYMVKGNKYESRICWMYDSAKISFDVTVVCNLYKRVDSVVKQVEALEKQSLRPKKIILNQDGIGSNYTIKILDEFKAKFSDIKIATENKGVWERFKFAKEVVDTPYVCIFDDDTIPGERWLENCHTQMIKQKGIYGTNGVLLTKKDAYPIGGFINVGWHKPVRKTTQVDFVGHSWFMPTECLDYMLKDTNKYQELKYVGEDMCVSFMAKKYGYMTFVPPHPVNNLSLWGSIPLYGNLFGKSTEALSMNMNNLLKMQNAIRMFEEDGWVPLCMENKKIVVKAKKNINKEKIYYLIYRVFKKIKKIMKF